MRLFYIFFITFFTSYQVKAQTYERKGEKTNVTTVNLICELNDSIQVILFDDSQFIVKTSLRVFVENLENWLIKYPHLSDDKKLLNLVLERAKNDSIVDVSNIAISNNLASRLEYRTASLLQNGQCLVQNKNEQKIEIYKELKIEFYKYECGPLCGDGGRRFFVNNTLILKVTDWMR